jgi:hypothetical protein
MIITSNGSKCTNTLSARVLRDAERFGGPEQGGCGNFSGPQAMPERNLRSGTTYPLVAATLLIVLSVTYAVDADQPMPVRKYGAKTPPPLLT